MPISTELADGLTEVDVIICGGGTAACVVAGRLAEADTKLSILVIESGENNDGKDNVKHPALLREHIFPGSKTANFYAGKKSEAVAGRSIVVPTGGLLGGGSSINIMLYSRAQGVDFDSWATPGWTASDMIPLMRKLETYHGTGDEFTHGYNGPIQITDGGFRGVKSQEDLISAFTRLGYSEYTDLQDPTKINDGVERALKYITTDGQRSDAAHAYVHPLLTDGKHPNLHVLCQSKVNRILFDENKRAVGVEHTSNPQFTSQPGSAKSPRRIVKAREMVVVSCGACGTPSVLERSGLGDREVLERASVPQIADVPGIGENYDDHTMMPCPFSTNLGPYDTLDAYFSGKMSQEEASKRDMLRWNSCDVHGKLRPTEADVLALGPEFRAAWDKDYRDRPNRPLMMMGTMAGLLDGHSSIPPGQYFALTAYSAYSYSRGHLHITGPEWEDPIDFDPGFFSDPNDIDIKMHMWAYKKMRAVMRSTDMYTGEVLIGHPKFSDGSKAACATNTCANSVVGDPEYTAEDDKAIEKHLRENIGSTWHSLGTAKMAPRDKMGVVDSELNVYGVQRLKCVDLSIVPFMVAANTNNTALVVGEKGAEIIMRELGLKH